MRLIIKERMIVKNIPIVANHKKDNLYKMKTPCLKHRLLYIKWFA